MTSNPKAWPIDTDVDAIDRYLEDALDLSTSINAGQRISDLRNLADLSVLDLADKSGMTSLELLALEAGMMQLKPVLAERIAEHLGVAYTDLFLSDESPDRQY